MAEHPASCGCDMHGPGPDERPDVSCTHCGTDGCRVCREDPR